MSKLLQLLMFPAVFAGALLWADEYDEALEDDEARLATDDIIARMTDKGDL